MTKFHINKHGVPAPCKAQKGNCPYGGDTGEENHFNTYEEAESYANEMNEKEYGVIAGIQGHEPKITDGMGPIIHNGKEIPNEDAEIIMKKVANKLMDINGGELPRIPTDQEYDAIRKKQVVMDKDVSYIATDTDTLMNEYYHLKTLDGEDLGWVIDFDFKRESLAQNSEKRKALIYQTYNDTINEELEKLEDSRIRRNRESRIKNKQNKRKGFFNRR